MQFIQIPAFNDNYIWLIEKSGHAWVVDPGDSKVVIDYLEKNSLILDGFLITHHHKDHIGGISSIIEWASHHQKSKVYVYGPQNEEIPLRTHNAQEGDLIQIFDGVSLKVMDVGGHTSGHIAYFLENTSPPRVFCGDTLFASGCGRIFEGTADQMFRSLQKLACLPLETLIYCAHEYTLSNLRFANAVEPNNLELHNWTIQAKSMRENNLSTVPTSIDLELKVNPFLRCYEPTLAAVASAYADKKIVEPVEVFSVLRKWKDVFK